MAKILVIDENNVDREAYQFAAQGIGAVAEFLEDRDPLLEAFAALAARDRGEIKAIIVLWELSLSVSGPQVISFSRRHFPGVPIIVVNSTLNVRLAAKAKDLGAKKFLMKPLDKHSLQKTLQAAIQPNNQHDPVFQEMKKILVGDSEAFNEALMALAKAIPMANTRILLIGESGTGKEMLAKAIHELGPRKPGPWIAVNCSSIPVNLLESALFGHEHGSFTGATERHKGFLETAGNGTLFLDEIGDMELNLQVKLLRAIEEKTFRRVGGSAEIPFQARLECATHHNLAAAIGLGRFRSDLYYRISEYEVRVPPLRERGEDLPLLVKHFLGKHSQDPECVLTGDALLLLKSHPFKGNVRELENLIKRALIEKQGKSIEAMDFPVEAMVDTESKSEDARGFQWPTDLYELSHPQAMAVIERNFNKEYLPRCIRESGNKILPAARRANIDPKTWRKKWKDCGLSGSSEFDEEG